MLKEFHEWADAWGISNDALLDLAEILGVGELPKHKASGPESDVQQVVRLEASRKGAVLWRNNIGVTEQHVRFGLCNDSPQVNKRLKSADLVGIRPTLVTQAMVGRTVGVFLAREVKRAGWTYGKKSEKAREEAQLRWLTIVLSMGGDAAFADGEGSL